MQLQDLPYGADNKRQYDYFVLWFKENYPNFYELYLEYIEVSPDLENAAIICNNDNLTTEESDCMTSIIKYYNSRYLNEQ